MRTSIIVTFVMLLHLPGNAQVFGFDFDPASNKNIRAYGGKAEGFAEFTLELKDDASLNVSFHYRGSMKDNLPEGYGELAGREYPFKYTGYWHKGKPSGAGILTTYKAGLLTGTNDFWFSKENNKISQFKGNFQNGIATEGLMITAFTKELQPTVYYSGQVKTEGARIIWHGYGTVLRTDTSAADQHLGVAGAFYEGQFFNGYASGYGIGNCIGQGLEGLSLMLVMCDKVATVYETYPLRTEYLLGDKFYPPPDNKFASLLPDLGKAKSATVSLDSLNEYRGTMITGLPYGLGYIEDKNGFRDIGIWNKGNKIAVPDLLIALLPDKSALVPKYQKEYIRVPKKKKNKSYNDYNYSLEWEKRKVAYYASFNNEGKPQGWGWKIDTEDPDARPMAGKFAGLFTAKEWADNADTIFMQCGSEWAHAGAPIGGSYLESERGRVFQSEYRGYDKLNIFGLQFPATPAIRIMKPLGNMVNYKSIAFGEDSYARGLSMNNFLSWQNSMKIENETINKKPVINMSKIVIYKNRLYDSYVTDGSHQVKGKMKSYKDIARSDFVWIDGRFKMVKQNNGNIQLDDYSFLPNNGNQYLVISDYILRYRDNEWKCPVCKGSGAISYMLTSYGVSGYNKKTVDYGITMQATQITPVYSAMGSKLIKEDCKACNGVGTKMLDETIVEIN